MQKEVANIMTNFGNPMDVKWQDKGEGFDRERRLRSQRRQTWLRARYPALFQFNLWSKIIMIICLIVACGCVVKAIYQANAYGQYRNHWEWMAFSLATVQSAAYLFVVRALFHLAVDAAMKYLEPAALVFGERRSGKSIEEV